MWLVLCDPTDRPALWLGRQLQARLGPEVEILSPVTLASALRWEHRLGKDRPRLRFQLADGRTIGDDALHGVVNRLLQIPMPHWKSAAEADRKYVEQELTAFYLSWLTGLECPVYNRPSPGGLCGQWRHESEWAHLAGRAGLSVPDYFETDTDGQPSHFIRLRPQDAPVHTVLVLDGEPLAYGLPVSVAAGCRKLATLAGTELLGVEFSKQSSQAWQFVGATPLPDLSAAGSLLVDRLVSRFQVNVPTSSNPSSPSQP